MVTYTDPARVLGVDRTAIVPTSGRTVTGYGGRLPTSYRVRYVGPDGRARWHRVRAMCYGNAASVYIVSAGAVLFLDIATECRAETC